MIQYDGVNDDVNHGSGATIDNLAALTYIGWIRPATIPSSYRRVISKFASGSGYWNLSITTFNGYPQVQAERIYSTTSIEVSNNNTNNRVADNTLIFAVFIDGGAGVAPRLFIGTPNLEPVEPGYDLRITPAGTLGNDAAGDLITGSITSAVYYPGEQGNWALFARAFTDADVRDAYYKRAIDWVNLPNCAVACDYNSTASLNDLTGNGNNGTNNGTVDFANPNYPVSIANYDPNNISVSIKKTLLGV